MRVKNLFSNQKLMWTGARQRRALQTGQTLIVALFLVLIVTVIGLSLVLNTAVDNVISNNYSKTVRATYTATSGIERFKAFLLYDYKHDPKQWGNRFLVVPQGSTYVDGTPAPPASEIGGSGSDAYFDLCPSCDPANPTIPSTEPYDINPNIPFASEPALFAEIPAGGSNPIVIPGSGYRLMLRNVPNLPGDTCGGLVDCNPSIIYLLAIGRTTTTIAYLNSKSRGMNVIEHGVFGADISVWNNIFFFDNNALVGGGAMTVHGNVHALGPPPPNVSTTTFQTRADVLNTYYYSNANKSLRDPIRSALSAPEQRDPTNLLAPVNNLGAAVRVRNGLIDISQGGAHIGDPVGVGLPFTLIANCRSCGSYGNGFTQANPAAYAQKNVSYDVPASLQPLIKVPNLNDPYKDPATNITYPNYTAYFIGLHTATTEYPGVLGIKLANALGSNNPTCFDIARAPCNVATNQLAHTVWAAKDQIFDQNAAPSIAQEQQLLDPIDPAVEPDPLFTPKIDVGLSGGQTFMIVATDEAQGVVIVYKEVPPFQRNIGGTNVAFPRVVHGFVFAPTGANMGALALKADVDGADIDNAQDGAGIHNWIFDTTDVCHGATPVDASCKDTLTPAQSNQLVLKVTDAIWKAGRGECGFSGPCYAHETVLNQWEPTMRDVNSLTSRVYDTTTGYLKVARTPPEDKDGKLIAYGAIETTDTVYVGGFTYAGRFTLYARDSDGAPAGVGRFNFSDNSYPISSYPISTSPPVYVAFPCQNNMGIMTPNDIDHSISPHDDFAGAFFAQGTIHLTRQEQILGAMVAGAWDFAGGGNPDFFQAMEISHCLPPYIIAKDPIVVVGSQSWLER